MYASSPTTNDMLPELHDIYMDNKIPSNDMYNPSQVSISPTNPPPASSTNSSNLTTRPIVPPTRPTRSIGPPTHPTCPIVPSTRPIVPPPCPINLPTPPIVPSYADKVRIPLQQHTITRTTHTNNATTSTKLSRTTDLYRTDHSRRTTPTSSTISTATSKYTLRTNHIPTIRGYSQDASILLSVGSDATKEIFFINLQPLIQNLLARKAQKDEMLQSVTTIIKELQYPTIGFFKQEYQPSFEYRYKATNPNGACGYILAYQLKNRAPTSPQRLNLYNSTTRSNFLSFLQQLLTEATDITIKDRISGVIEWVTISFHTVNSKREPFLPRKFWMMDDMLLHFNLQTTFTYFINSSREKNYLQCMFSTSTTHKVHYTYTDILTFIDTNSSIQHTSDHFLFSDYSLSPDSLLNSINEAVTDLSNNILNYFLDNPTYIKATIQYHVDPPIDLITPPSSPKLTYQKSHAPYADNLLSVEGALRESTSSHFNREIHIIKRQTTQPSLSNQQISLPPISIVSTRTTSGAPAPVVVDTTSNTYLFRYVNDPIFTTIRPFFYRIVENARKRELGFNTQPTQCTTCMQFFSKMITHTNNAEDSITGCYNVARLRMYICLRKNIPLPPSILPSGMAHPTTADLEKYLLKFN